MSFDKLREKVQKRFLDLVPHQLLRVDLKKPKLFEAYLKSLPESERQEHNCACCRSFMNRYGDMVAVANGKLLTLWDFDEEGDYEETVAALRKLVRKAAIDRPLIVSDRKLGTDLSRVDKGGEVIRWTHFYLEMPTHLVVADKKIANKRRSEIEATSRVFKRGLEEITSSAIAKTLELISSGLYRGAEFKERVEKFQKLQDDYHLLDTAKKRNRFIWENLKEGGRIRNSAIGTMLIDLSKDIDDVAGAKAKFAKVMHPANHGRSTSAPKQNQLEAAREALESMGLMPSLIRRHARQDDLNVKNLLFVNRTTNNSKDVFDRLSSKTPLTKVPKGKRIELEEFISSVLPGSSNVDLLLNSTHNFVSLLTAQDNETPTIFHWDNHISWTYQNNMADAIKEKVKRAGGSVDGHLRVSLEWFNTDDLDLHLIMPGGGKICFRDKFDIRTNGELDVDMNISGESTEPVENITFPIKSLMREGTYRVCVDLYSKRNTANLGFNLQIVCGDKVHNLHSPRQPHQDTQEFATFNFTQEGGITNFQSVLESRANSNREVNGLTTRQFHKVNSILWSPNYWPKKGAGNKHLFIILDKCRIDTPLIPFFNEYLNKDLHEHRKVFEQIANDLMVAPSDDQVTGVGFSITQKANFTVKVDGVVYEVHI